MEYLHLIYLVVGKPMCASSTAISSALLGPLEPCWANPQTHQLLLFCLNLFAFRLLGQDLTHDSLPVRILRILLSLFQLAELFVLLGFFFFIPLKLLPYCITDSSVSGASSQIDTTTRVICRLIIFFFVLGGHCRTDRSLSRAERRRIG
ncbi:hypothetical protein HG530_000346 [Fusarium avenaceum]|nr:hypothetical protein HG530_000346 [Fusarium avenaceum]